MGNTQCTCYCEYTCVCVERKAKRRVQNELKLEMEAQQTIQESIQARDKLDKSVNAEIADLIADSITDLVTYSDLVKLLWSVCSTIQSYNTQLDEIDTALRKRNKALADLIKEHARMHEDASN